MWKSLQIKKNELEMRNGHQNNEKRLFHGTCESTVPVINERGFNRSYAGKNGEMFGMLLCCCEGVDSESWQETVGKSEREIQTLV